MNIIGIIPARMGSSRFPGKPLANIHGLPMIEHVYKRANMCESLNDLFVATCDKEIFSAVQGFGGKAIMTDNCHERCTDRVAEAAHNMKADIVVIIQGDEPLIYPEMIDEAITPLIEDESILCSNLMALINSEEDFVDPNEVKVVVDKQNFALYLSREPIPSVKKGDSNHLGYKQVCIMPFKRDFLFTFTSLEPTPLEKIESVDMLRILEHGYKLKMVETHFNTRSVDNLNDLVEVEKMMVNDKLFLKYSINNLNSEIIT